MKSIDPKSLTNLPYRISYLRAFIDFTPADAAAIHASAPLISPLLPAILHTVYTKLLSFDITAASFLPGQTGYDGNVAKTLDELTLDHPTIKFRMSFLKNYLVKLVSMDYEADATWEYLDKVAIMHTGRDGFAHRAKKPGLRVEYIHMGLLLGYVMDILLDTITKHPDLDAETKAAVLKAFNKVIWIQNDLFARQYIGEGQRTVERCCRWNSPVVVGQVVAAGVAVVGVLGLQWFARYLN